MRDLNGYLQLIVQCGALGLLLVLFYGVFKVALVYAPLVKDFFLHLIASQHAIVQEQRAITVKLDETRAALTRMEADAKTRAQELEREIEQARDAILSELGGSWTRASSPGRTPSGGLQIVPRSRPSGGV